MGYRKHHPRKPSIVCTFFTSSCVKIGQWTKLHKDMVRAVRTSNGLIPCGFSIQVRCNFWNDLWWIVARSQEGLLVVQYVYIAFRSFVFFGCDVILEYRLIFCWHGRKKKVAGWHNYVACLRFFLPQLKGFVFSENETCCICITFLHFEIKGKTPIPERTNY